MAIQKKEIEYAKEIDDVAALLVKVLQLAKSGQDVMTIVAQAVQPLIEAVAGIDQAGTEFQANRKVALQSILLRVGEMVDELLPKPQSL